MMSLLLIETSLLSNCNKRSSGLEFQILYCRPTLKVVGMRISYFLKFVNATFFSLLKLLNTLKEIVCKKKNFLFFKQKIYNGGTFVNFDAYK